MARFINLVLSITVKKFDYHILNDVLDHHHKSSFHLIKYRLMLFFCTKTIMKLVVCAVILSHGYDKKYEKLSPCRQLGFGQ